MPLNTELSTAPNTQPNSDKPSPRSIQRKFRSLLLLAVSGGALIATPQLARAEFTPNPAAPNYVATGAETTPQVVTDNNANVTTDDTFSVITSEGNALTITGNGAIVYSDANSSDLVATGNFGALVVHSTGDDGIFGQDGYTRGKVTITTNGDLTGGSVGMDVTNSGSDRTNITSTGTVTATDSNGIGVKVAHGPSAYDMTVKVADVTGGQTGISIQKQGIGSTDLIATGTVIGTSGTGVFVTDNSAASGTRVTVVGVTGGTDGVRLEGYSIGDATITATGTVTGTTGTGIAVNYNNTSGNDLTVKAAAVTGGQTGISALNKGRGDTSVTATGTVAATGDSSTGIVVTNEENTVDLTVNAASVSGGEFGIKATNNGTGNTSVTATGTVTGSTGTGIDVLHNADGNLTVNAADVTGGINGIIVSNLGAGQTSITSTGTVTGTSGYGISVETNEDAQKLTVNANNVTGGLNGILANHKGSGETSVTATGTVIATTIGSDTDEGVGILVENTDKGSDITVNAHNVTGERSGIKATNNGDGNTSITSTGTVTGTQSGGISAIHGTDAQSITINAVNVSSTALGIYTSNQGQGSTSVTSTGTVVGSGGSGIKALNGENTQNLTVTAVNVSGGEYGITASNDGSGDTTIISTGTVAGTGAGGVGIRATNEANANDLTLEVNNVSGAPAGIKAVNEGKGDTSITSTGTITATEADYPDQEDDGVGLYVTNGSETGNLTVEVNNVNGAKTGILAQNSGTGNTSITATGTVVGTNDTGISVTNFFDANDLTVVANNVTGGLAGIEASNYGGGNTSVTATGTVEGTGNIGIKAVNSTDSKDISVNANNVTGATLGIQVQNYGSGSASVTSTGTVHADTDDGISVYNFEGTQDLTVHANNASGGVSGIYTQNEGKGDTSVTSTGTVEGKGLSGISVYNGTEAHDMTVNANNVTGEEHGIEVINQGSGVTSVTATGTVVGVTANGIDVDSGEATQGTTVEANNVTGAQTGINVVNNGSGDTTITASGTVVGTGDTGISVTNNEDTNDLTVEANNVTGGLNGIMAVNKGSGETKITATGTVIATSTGTELEDGVGIYVENTNQGSDITVQANNVTGTQTGIQVINFGQSNTSVTATGTVEGTGVGGINVSNSANSVDLTVHAAIVIGSKGGIGASNAGSGNTSVTATGAVTATDGTGILVSNGSTTSGSLTVHAAAVTGSEYGIGASNMGTGNTSVTATGTVTATGDESVGVHVSNGEGAGELTVDVHNVTADGLGVYAQNQGSGDTSVTATGTVKGTGANGAGIDVSHTGDTGKVTLDVVNVTGTDHGIYVFNGGTATTSLTSTGTVTGSGRFGIGIDNEEGTTGLTANVVNVNGNTTGLFANNNGSGNTSITSTGTVSATGDESIGIDVTNGEDAVDLTVAVNNASGVKNGIKAVNNGSGNTSVTATGTVTGTGEDSIGLLAENGGSTVDLTVEVNNVSGGQIGISASNNGTGTTSVTATGTVVGTADTGINVGNGENANGLTVDAHNVTGGQFGVRAYNYGSGDTSLSSTGAIEGTDAIGIHAINGSNTRDLTVDVNNVTSQNMGILIGNSGSGNTSVTATGTIVGTNWVGLDVVNSSTTQDLTVEANNVSGGQMGINISNNGKGNTSVTAIGTVTGTAEDSDGMIVRNDVTANDLTVEANNVSGGARGITVENYGKGNTSVTSIGTVTATAEGSAGIHVENGATAIDLTVEANNVTGGQYGIFANNSGSGATSVTATGTVTGTTYAGIEAQNSETGVGLTVHANNVTGGELGISATNNGSGDTSITATGAVEGTQEGSTGINVFSGGNTSNLTVKAAAVTGGDVGINANNEGDGDTLIKATGLVEGTNNVGIQVSNHENAHDLTVEAAAVTGGNNGIVANNYGSGNTSVTAKGTVASTTESGIRVFNGENAVDLTVEAVAVTGGVFGISVENSGTGDTSVSATGTVTGTGYMGVNVNNGENTQNLTVEAVTVNGAEDGINVLNNGTGDTSITVTGKATGTNYAGIYAVNSENAQSLTVEAVAATGGLYGIYAENNGSGNTGVTATGMILGTGEGSTGINVFSGGNTHNLTIEAASVTGVDVGINANNEGDGDTLIKATGLVEGTDNIGIQVGNNENANDLTVEAAAVTGGQSGIVANNNGRGDTSVTATGTVTGENGDGIHAYNGSLAQNLTVSAVNVTGSEHGISAQNDGNGDTSVTSTGTVEGEAGHGIFVTSSVTANNLSVNAVNVIGASQGINTNNDGSGNTSITSTGTVTGKGSHGIMAWNQSAAGNLSIEAVNVTGAGKGISANNFGTGDTSVTATGTVSGQNEEGVYVDNGEGTNDLTVNVVNVTGKTSGIYTNNLGTGNTSITATGTVTSTHTDGIVALNGANAVDLTVNVANVTASQIGITVDNQGSGNTSLTATGTVTGTLFRGINAINGENAQDLTVNAVSVTGFYEGVYARNAGNGDTSVTVTGTATATRASGVGIKAINNANNQNLTVNVANATGGATGVTTYNGGTGTTAINVSGIVEGGDEGIGASSSDNQAIIITINGTVRNSSQSSADTAIVNGSGIVIINNNQSLLGTVSLGASGNTINNKGTWNAGGGTSDLGSGANILNNQAGGSILAVGSDGPVSTTFNGVDTLTHSGSIVLQNQRAGGTTAYAGDVVTFTNGGSGDFQANGGVVYLDTDFENETSDVLVVDNVSRQGNATMLAINPTRVAGKALAGDGIELVDVQGTSSNDAFVLAEPVASAGLFNYTLGQGTQDTQSWFLQSSVRTEVVGAGVLSVLGSRTALSTLPGMQDRLREDNPDEQLFGQRSGARLVSRDLTLPDARPQATKGVWGRLFGENSKFQSENGAGYDAKLWGAQAGLDFYATSNQKGDRQYAGVYLAQASASGDALGGSGVIGSMNVDATTVGAYYTYSAARGWYVDATAQYSKLSDMKLAAGGETVRPDGSSYAVSLEAGKVLNQQSKLRTELQAQVIYQKTDIDDITLSDNTRLTLGGLNTTTGRVGVRLSKNPQYAGKFQPWLRANLWHTLNEEATVSSMGTTMGTAIGGTSGEVQVGFALAPSKASSWSAYAAAGYTFDLSGAQYSGWKGSLGLRKGW